MASFHVGLLAGVSSSQLLKKELYGSHIEEPKKKWEDYLMAHE